ncbi:MAG TPA: hypothetical protein VIL35_15605 [Vicinamibacterales bacterium]
MAISHPSPSAAWDIVRCRAGAVLAVFLALAVPVRTLPAQPQRSPEAALAPSLDAIRSAFLANDAGRLLRCFPDRHPVLVYLPPLERGRFLGPGPLRALLGRVVSERRTVALELIDGVPDPRGDPQVRVKARWSYRTADSDTLHIDVLHLALRFAPEDREWLIVELKTATR